MAKTCNFKGCGNPVFGGGFCSWHQYKRTDKKPAAKKKLPKRIKPVSESMALRLKAYRVERDKFMNENNVCQFTGCNKEANDLHHKAGRGKNLSNVSTFMAVCRFHHNWIHEHPKESRELKYLI